MWRYFVVFRSVDLFRQIGIVGRTGAGTFAIHPLGNVLTILIGKSSLLQALFRQVTAF
jgi:hypothetical protein